MSKILIVIVLLVNYNATWSQITLINPSFEDTPADATVPKGWLPCQDGTTPDILPGFWGEYNKAAHGNTYVGLITRENSTYESIGQRLSQSLDGGACYSFVMNLAHGKVYSGYNQPIKLRVWIGGSKCSKEQLIYESPLITNRNWSQYKVEFTPKKEAKYIIFEAYISDKAFTHKGNILMDKVSAIIPCGRA